MSVKRFLLVVTFLLLQACGGGGGSSSPVVSSESSASSSSSSIAASSSSKSSVATSLPADFPVGTAEVLPVLNLKTDGSAPILSKTDYLKGSFSLVETGAAAVEGTLEVRGRGNSTWGWVKKPYRLKLTTSTALLGMPKGKNWVLLANYADKTLVRNDTTFMFSRRLGMEYTPRAHYVELNVNGAYQGVYQLSEHIRVDKDRVNIDEMKVTDTDADKITGGYLMEVDFRLNKNYCIGNTWDPVCVNGVNTQRDIDFCIDSENGMQPACLANPETLHDAAWSAQRDYIVKYYRDMEAALFGSNFADPATGYAAYIDVDSVVNYYLVNEVLKNVDGAEASFFLYKKRGGKLFFGPVWDFDLALGNAGYNQANIASGWYIRNYPWFKRMFEDPAFAAKVKARWKALKEDGTIDQIAQYAEARATWLNVQQKKNYQLWSINDFAEWILHPPLGTYELEVQALINWQKARIAWLDTEFSK